MLDGWIQAGCSIFVVNILFLFNNIPLKLLINHGLKLKKKHKIKRN